MTFPEPARFELRPSAHGVAEAVGLPRLESPTGDYRSLSLFGLTVVTDFPFTVGLPSATGAADLVFEVSPLPVLAHSGLTPAYQSPYRAQDGESLAYLYRFEGSEILHCPSIADFRIGPDRIDVHFSESASELAELRLLGPVLSYWLEQRGIPTLHASAVATERGAAAFLSHKEGGKTGLAAAFLQAGLPLLTDDVLPVEESGGVFLARPGFPQMRMWPDEAAHFVEGWERLARVHPAISKRRVPVGDGGFGAFQDAPLPLACLYLPERLPEGTDGPVEILDVSPRDAVIELVRHSFSPRLVEAAGLQARRLDFFARLALHVPVRRLRYPSGFGRLPEVVNALRAAW